MQTFIIILVLAIALILFIASRKPNTFRVERRIEIAAPAEAIFPHINDFHLWTAWSPWENVDPDLQRTYSGADSGVGAKYAWLGNKKIGQGNMTILETQTPTYIKIDLQFIKPFKASNIGEFTLKEGNGTTIVVWTMSGPSPLISKVMGLFMNMDNMIGSQFELGLQSLKQIAESRQTVY